MKTNVGAKSLSDMEAGKAVFGFQVHGNGDKAAYQGKIGDYCRGLSIFYFILAQRSTNFELLMLP